MIQNFLPVKIRMKMSSFLSFWIVDHKLCVSEYGLRYWEAKVLQKGKTLDEQM